MKCKCKPHTDFMKEYDIMNIPLSDEMNLMKELIPELPIEKRTVETYENLDFHVHKFSGSVNDVPLNSANLFSYKSKKKQNCRQFRGKIANELFDYSMTVSSEDNIINVDIDFNEPVIPDLKSFKFSYDTKSNWLISTTPDVLSMKPALIGSLSPAQTMVFLASNKPQRWDWHCLAHIIIHVGGLCAWVFVGGGPNPATIAAYILCAGPAIVAALIGCKK